MTAVSILNKINEIRAVAGGSLQARTARTEGSRHEPV